MPRLRVSNRRTSEACRVVQNDRPHKREGHVGHRKRDRTLLDQAWRDTRGANLARLQGDGRAAYPRRDDRTDWHADLDASDLSAAHVANAVGRASRCGGRVGPTPKPMPTRRQGRRVDARPHWLLRGAILLAVLRPAVSHAAVAWPGDDVVVLPAQEAGGGDGDAIASRGMTAGAEVQSAPIREELPSSGACAAPPDWAALSPGGKAEQALACTMSSADEAISDALRRLHAEQKRLAQQWATATDAEMRQAEWAGLPGSTRQTLTALASLTSVIETQPDLTFVDTVAHGRALFSHPTLPDGGVEAVYFRKLWPNIDNWARVDELPALFASPINYLRVSYVRQHKQLTAALTDDYRQLAQFDRRALELAAVLYAKASPGTVASLIARDFNTFVSHFKQAVTQDLRWRHAGAQALPIALRAPSDRSIWFDGTALRGALGLNLRMFTAQLIKDRQRLDALSAEIAFNEAESTFPPEKMRDLIRDRLAALMESTDYLFGTPQQSLATVVMRLGPMHGVSTIGVGSPATLIERFEELELAWKRAPRYPIAPYAAAAFHLARSSDVVMLDGRPVDVQFIERVRDRYASEVEALHVTEAVDEWLAKYQFSLWTDLPFIARSSALALAPSALRQAAGEYVRLAALPERMVITDPVSGLTQLAAYLSERLLAYVDPAIVAGLAVPRTASANEAETDESGEGEGGPTPVSATEDTSEAAYASYAEVLRGQARERLRLRGQAPTSVAIDEDLGRASASASAAQSKGGLEFSRQVVDRLLIGSTMIRQAATPGMTVLDFIPFVGSACQFGKGLVERDASEALRGAFGFGMDAMFVWLGGVGGRFIERQIAREVGEIALAAHEARAVAMLTDFGRQLGSPIPGTLPLERVSVNPDPLGVLQVDASVPLEHRAAAAAARRGELAEVTMANGIPARLVHSPARGLVTPIRRDGQRVLELDWKGDVLQALDFAYGDEVEPAQQKVNGPHAAAGASSAAADAVTAEMTALRLPRGFSAVVFPEVLDPAFRLRPTVTAIEALFASLQVADPLRPAPRVSAFLAVANDATEAVVEQGRDIIVGLQSLCDRSATMQALLRGALKKMPKNAPRVELQIVPNARPVCDIVGGVIRVPPLHEIPSMSYVDMQGSTPFQPKRAWLHELVHAMTKLRDVTPEERMRHRGPVVYLTDRILFEAGHDVRERIMYQPASRAALGGRAELIERQIDAARPACTTAMIAEDAYLDAVLQALKPELPPDRVLNVATGRRFTVTQARTLASQVVAARDTLPLLGKQMFYQRVINLWYIQVDRDFGLNVEWAESFRDYGNSFYMQDEIFRHLAERWLGQNGAQAWRLMLAQRVPAGAPPLAAWSINRRVHLLTLYRDPLFYQSQSGPRELELKRRIAGAWLDLISPGGADFGSPEHATENRGLRVYLENRLLAGTRYPKRVSAQLAEDGPSLLPFAIKARRAAEAEDVFLGEDILERDD